MAPETLRIASNRRTYANHLETTSINSVNWNAERNVNYEDGFLKIRPARLFLLNRFAKVRFIFRDVT